VSIAKTKGKPKEISMKAILVALCASFLFLAPASSSAGEKAAGGTAAATKAPKVFSAPQKEGVKAVCPVMGSEFTIGKDTLHSEYQGKHVYFCCPGCKGKFDKNPKQYLK
jgi:YHS domain-containing protein